MKCLRFKTKSEKFQDGSVDVQQTEKKKKKRKKVEEPKPNIYAGFVKVWPLQRCWLFYRPTKMIRSHLGEDFWLSSKLECQCWL